MKLYKILIPLTTVALLSGTITGISATSANNGLTTNNAHEISQKLINSMKPTHTEPVSYDTRTVEIDTLPASVSLVVQEGKNGTKSFWTNFTKSKDSNGQTILIPITSETITTLPVEEVIHKGTNQDVINGISDKTKKIEKEKAEKLEREKKEAEAKIAAEKKAKEEAERKARINKASRSKSRTYSTESSNGMTSPAENRAYAQSVLSAGEFACADVLVNRESGWKTNATNPSSGAYGVPQSLPAKKLASAGADWRTNGKTQIKWMQGYVKDRYGTFCNAVKHSDRKGWY